MEKNQEILSISKTEMEGHFKANKQLFEQKKLGKMRKELETV